jgi:hypothetical protein
MFLTEPVLDERLDDLRRRQAGVLRILERHEAEALAQAS